MSQSLKRLQKIEAALEQLLKKEDAIVVWHHKVETEEQCLQAAIQAGRYDPNTQDLVLIRSNIERRSQYGNQWSSELPEPRKRTLAQEIEEMARAPRFEGTYPTEPPPEASMSAKCH
jgi:hypothetical protein